MSVGFGTVEQYEAFELDFEKVRTHASVHVLQTGELCLGRQITDHGDEVDVDPDEELSQRSDSCRSRSRSMPGAPGPLAAGNGP
jgi:hypothetical protein